MRHGMWVSALLAIMIGPCVPRAGANFFKPGFMVQSESATTWTASASTTGKWYGSGFSTTSEAAVLTHAKSGRSEDRVLLQAIPIPVAATYQVQVRARFSSPGQRFYWHILLVTEGTSISLTQGGVPTNITQPGVKSLVRVAPSSGNATGQWVNYSNSFTINAADAAAYKYAVIALVASRAESDVAQFDDVHTDMPATTTDPDAGLTAEWYHITGSTSRVSTMPWGTPVKTTKEEQVNFINTTNAAFTSGVRLENFGVKLTGTITIPATGLWTFTLGSDDGAWLRIDNRTVAIHESPRSFGRTAGSVQLAAGKYPFEVRFYENGGQQGLQVWWRGPGVATDDVIPASAFALASRIRVVKWVQEAED